MSRRCWRHVAPLAIALGTAGCHAFVLHEAPVAPEAAPITRMDVAGADTTYVLRTDGYALLSHDRRLLWTRSTLDDAAHRFRALLGVAPQAIAVRVDTAPAVATASAWEGLPLVTVAAGLPERKRIAPGEAPAREVPQIAARAARAWVRALGVPATAWWFEAGAARVVADANASVSVVPQAANAGDRTSLAALLDGPPLSLDAAIAIVPTRERITRSAACGDVGGYGGVYGGSASADGSTDCRLTGAQAAAARVPVDAVRGPLVAAQAAALLLFLRDRDPAFVAALPERLRAGATLPDLLARSATLPHTVDAFDTAWRKWLRSRPSRSREAQRPR